jgi:hypothetical protein
MIVRNYHPGVSYLKMLVSTMQPGLLLDVSSTFVAVYYTLGVYTRIYPGSSSKAILYNSSIDTL